MIITKTTNYLTAAVRNKTANTCSMSRFYKIPYSTYSTYTNFHIVAVLYVIVYLLYTTNNTTTLFYTFTVRCKELV